MIPAFPSFTAVTFPVLSTLITSSFLDVHFTPEISTFSGRTFTLSCASPPGVSSISCSAIWKIVGFTSVSSSVASSVTSSVVSSTFCFVLLSVAFFADCSSPVSLPQPASNAVHKHNPSQVIHLFFICPLLNLFIFLYFIKPPCKRKM